MAVSIWDGGPIVVSNPVETVATTPYSLVLADYQKYKRFTAAAAKTFTITKHATVAFPVGFEFIGCNRAATNNLTLVADAGVTLNAPAGGDLIFAPGESFMLKNVAENVWDVIQL